MMQIILLVMALLCQNPNHKGNVPGCNKMHVVTMSNPGDDGNGETGHVPPKPPPPPPPPGN